jgi:hypothetical protein
MMTHLRASEHINDLQALKSRRRTITSDEKYSRSHILQCCSICMCVRTHSYVHVSTNVCMCVDGNMGIFVRTKPVDNIFLRCDCLSYLFLSFGKRETRQKKQHIMCLATSSRIYFLYSRHDLQKSAINRRVIIPFPSTSIHCRVDRIFRYILSVCIHK